MVLCFTFSCLLSVLFRNGYWKLADFGLTSEATSNRLITTSAARGKPCYRSPELLRGVESVFNNKSDIWSFGCIAYELFTGKKAFANDHEAWQYGVANRSPKMYFKGLDDLQKHYIYGLLEVDPTKRPSAKALLKEKFLTETPSAKSPEDARAHKRRRIDQSSPTPSSLLKNSLKWAVSNKQLDLIIVLAETRVEPVSSLEVYHLLEAFDYNESNSFHTNLGGLIDLFPPSFWRSNVPGFVLDAEATANTTSESVPLFNHAESRPADDEPEKSWSVSPISTFHGHEWYAICIKDIF